MSNSRQLRKIVFILGFSCLAHDTLAAPVVYDLSGSLTLTGTIAQSPIQPQSTGALTATFSGFVNIDATQCTLQFTGGKLVAETNGNWQPLPGGSPGSAPACYGVQAAVPLNSIPQIALGAVRNLALSLISSNLPSVYQFSADGLVFALPTNSTAAFDYNVGGLLAGSATLAGYCTNRPTQMGGFVGGGEVSVLILVLPVSVNIPFTLVSAHDSLLTLSGNITGLPRDRTLSIGGPVIQSITVTTQTVTLQWEACVFNQSQVETSSDLKTWTPLGWLERHPPQTSMIWSTNAAQPVQFFRVVQE